MVVLPYRIIVAVAREAVVVVPHHSNELVGARSLQGDGVAVDSEGDVLIGGLRHAAIFANLNPIHAQRGIVVGIVIHWLSYGDGDGVTLAHTLDEGAVGVVADDVLHVNGAILALHDIHRTHLVVIVNATALHEIAYTTAVVDFHYTLAGSNNNAMFVGFLASSL